MCVEVTLGVSEEHIKKIEISTRAQASDCGFYRHRAGRIGASQCFSAFHRTNLAQLSQSLLRQFVIQASIKSTLKPQSMAKARK